MEITIGALVSDYWRIVAVIPHASGDSSYAVAGVHDDGTGATWIAHPRGRGYHLTIGEYDLTEGREGAVQRMLERGGYVGRCFNCSGPFLLDGDDDDNKFCSAACGGQFAHELGA